MLTRSPPTVPPLRPGAVLHYLTPLRTDGQSRVAIGQQQFIVQMSA